MKNDCEHYEDCRLPVRKCNTECSEYRKADWAAQLKEDQQEEDAKGVLS